MNTTPVYSCLVLDAFGTIAHLPAKTRPYALLRDQLAAAGRPIEGFAQNVMTHPWDMKDAARYYGGADIDLRQAQAALVTDLATMVVLPAAISCIGKVCTHLPVVLGSNLALPYGERLCELLRQHGLVVSAHPSAGGLSAGFSYVLGHVKPDPRFYERIGEGINCPPAAVLMVGDRQDEDFHAPRRAGWSALPPFDRSQSAQAWSEVLGVLFPGG